MSSSSPGSSAGGRPPLWVVVLGLLVLMARLTEAAQNLRHVLADSDSDSTTKTKAKIKPKASAATNDLVDTEAATSNLVHDDVVEDTAEPISAPIVKRDAAKDTSTTEKNLRRLAESSNNDQDTPGDEVEPDFMYWVTPLQSLGLTCGGSSIKSRDGEYTCIKAGEALCQDNDGGPFGRWTFGITEDNQVNLWTPKNEIAWTFCTDVSHVCIGEERDPRPDKYSNQRPYLYFYDEKTQRTVGNLTCDGTDGFNGENLDKPTILKMVDNSNVGMYADYNITVLKFKKGQTPDPGDSNELLNITVVKIGDDMVGSLSFNEDKCTWTDTCRVRFASYIPQIDVSLINQITIQGSTFIRVDFGNVDGNENEIPYEFWVGEGPDGDFSFLRDNDGRISGHIENITSSMMTEFSTNDSGDEISSEYPTAFDIGEDTLEFDTTGDLDEEYLAFDADDNATEIITTSSTPQSRRQLKDSGTATIDMVFVWTREAECIASQLPRSCRLNSNTEARVRNLINRGVRTTNAQLARSGVDVKIRNVHSYRHPTYKENKDLFRGEEQYPDHWHALECARGNLDDCLGDVPAIRRRYNADLVNLVLSSLGGYGERAETSDDHRVHLSTSPATGYFQKTLRHEFGHNMGCKHERAEPSVNECLSDLVEFNGVPIPSEGSIGMELKDQSMVEINAAGNYLFTPNSNYENLYDGETLKTCVPYRFANTQSSRRENFYCFIITGGANVLEPIPGSIIPYNYGYQEPTCLFHDIMAYGCGSGQCDKDSQPKFSKGVPAYSNPERTYPVLSPTGEVIRYPTGAATDNCARTMNEFRRGVENYSVNIAVCLRDYTTDFDFSTPPGNPTKTNFKFGSTVAIEGNTAAVASDPYVDGEDKVVYIYTRPSETEDWVQESLVRSRFDWDFGASIAICDGTVFVGSPGNYGRVYAYTPVAGRRRRQIIFDTFERNQDQAFGASISCFKDTLIVGSPNYAGHGQVFLFRKSYGRWRRAELRTLSLNLNAGDHYGASVSISNGYIIIGAPGDGLGSAYIFSESYVLEEKRYEWTLEQKLVNDDSSVEMFGSSVAIDHSKAIVGSPGAVFLFSRDRIRGEESFVWTERGNLEPPASASSMFGRDDIFVRDSFDVEESLILVGDPGESGNGARLSGAAHIFSPAENGVTFAFQRTVPGRDSSADYSVGFDGTTLLIGAPGVGSGSEGAAYTECPESDADTPMMCDENDYCGCYEKDPNKPYCSAIDGECKPCYSFDRPEVLCNTLLNSCSTATGNSPICDRETGACIYSE